MASREYKNTCEREWLPLEQMAHEYLGVGPELLRAAINRGELDAYDKPPSSSIAPGRERKYHKYFLSRADVDHWIRTYWPKVARV